MGRPESDPTLGMEKAAERAVKRRNYRQRLPEIQSGHLMTKAMGQGCTDIAILGVLLEVSQQ